MLAPLLLSCGVPMHAPGAVPLWGPVEDIHPLPPGLRGLAGQLEQGLDVSLPWKLGRDAPAGRALNLQLSHNPIRELQ